MRSYHKKTWTFAIIATFVLFYYSFSFAQNEGIKGVQLKDGSIIYGRVIKMNVDDIQIETKDGKIVSRKSGEVDNLIIMENLRGIRFKDGGNINVDKVIIVTKERETVTRQYDDVASFIKEDDKQESKGKKEVFNIAIGAERMSGKTTYQIGYPVTLPNGTKESGYFPFSQLEWPLDVWLARIEANLNIGKSWRINGVLKKNVGNPNGNMKDSDWLTDSNPGQLDSYSESNISKFDAWIFDVDAEWIFLKRQSWSLYTGLGYQYQKFDYEAKLIHQYSPSGLPETEYYGDGRVAITYEITHSMPYLKLGTSFTIKDKFTLDGSFAWSPIVKAKDEDHHLLRENGGKIATGDMDGNAYMINLSGKYNFTHSWFVKGGVHYTKIHVEGEQYQIYGNGTPIASVREKSDSTQTSGYMTVGYAF
jgi:outer membrane protease